MVGVSFELPTNVREAIPESVLRGHLARCPVEASGYDRHLLFRSEALFPHRTLYVEEEVEDEQAEEEEEPFPPRAERKEPVDIDDPWRGPATYAEDFYSGGDLPASSAKHGDPHVLPNEGDDPQAAEDEQAVHSTEARVQEDDDGEASTSQRRRPTSQIHGRVRARLPRTSTLAEMRSLTPQRGSRLHI
ncbi:hypothetical protein NUW54_g13543 [Trametes sanguinea]|uniref:Uncharacterized protein n=1 Tax=Trametes sanguinea TaxID=158606 RepID=A0ACC1MJV0_9APHY|nr:hypothetical protein NUW54_g13543 [Trametes sanguinea]